MSVEVSLNCIPVINFSMQQNHARIIRELAVTNQGEDNLENIEINFTFDPDFGHVAPLHVAALAPGESFQFADVPLQLSTAFLSNLTERIEGSIKVEVRAGDKTVGSTACEVAVLAFDQWGGISVLPAMLAAFVTPNHPDIPRVIRRAADILGTWTGSPAFDEYQTRDPNRAKMQMAAIYEAIAELQIAYCTVPASFEDRGQRVRLASEILETKLGTCLDMALFYASCLEAVGLNPLLVLVQGHAFAGAWLVPESFPDSVNDDVSLLTKRTAEGINEILLVETTCMNAGSIVSFDDAVVKANSRLANSEVFQLFIDVLRARNARIRPLPLRVARDGGGFDIQEESEATAERGAEAPTAMTETHRVEDVEHIGVTKQTIWERKLLDLSLRNNLLNTRITSNTIQLITANVAGLEDALAAGVEFQVLPRPSDWDSPLVSAGIYQALNASNPIVELVKSELEQKRLYSYLSEDALPRALTHLYRSSRLALEENGANTLYLAVGLLKWFETPTSTRPRFAPILLVPVEIIRKAASRNYVIRSRDEDTALNITLLELLRQDFGITIGGLENLPTDENGVDVPRVFNIFRRAIMSQTRWDVEEQAILGNFSFNKFIMWNDIHNNADKLARNPIVASLISGKSEWESLEADTEEVQDLDAQFPAGSVALPIGADSSQFEAICAAVNDRSFILHGPPGTGKSQTITNIIANALYNGKKVLFVAEKMAALQVVQRRLEAIGLAPFCLELHSNKTKKSYILEQLKRTTEVVKCKSAEAFGIKAGQINELRRELNTYVANLHHVQPVGLSLYDCFTRYASVPYDGPTVEISTDILKAATPGSLADALAMMAEFRAAAVVCGSLADSAMTEIGITDYSSALKQEAAAKLETFAENIDRYKSAAADIYKIFGMEPDSGAPHQRQVLAQLTTLLETAPALPMGLLNTGGTPEVFESIAQAIAHGRERDRAHAVLAPDFSDTILAWDFTPCENVWRRSAGEWWLPRVLHRMKVKSQLKKFMRSSAKLTVEKVDEVFGRLNIYTDQQRHLQAFETDMKALFGALWNTAGAEWDKLEGAAEAVRTLNILLLKLAGNITRASNAKTKLYRELLAGIGTFRHMYSDKLRALIEADRALQSDVQQLSALLGANRLPEMTVEQMATVDAGWMAGIDNLRDWTALNVQCRRVAQAGFGRFVEAVKKGIVQPAEIEHAFAKSFYKAYAEYIIDNEKALKSFYGVVFDEKIELFRKFSAEFESLTRQELFARLASGLPALQKEASQGSEVGILQRNIRNGGRGTSIRRLFDQIPELLTRMCPCMLMSPISVAQYIDAERVPFDLVIFDEASQMPTSEAVGAIARGRNVVVVGDPKQMPPTSFFTSNTFDDDNADKEDLENILEDCLALTMPSKYLRWHYRSRHESLIAFSNIKYYDNKLYTFPSPDDLTTKVGWQYVEGVYDRGKSRQNRAEAEAVVEEIRRRLSDPDAPRRSIGVVTFNTNQQSLIEDLLTDLFSANPELESVAAQFEEPIFIKNLENVQGDERDIILFSIGYGPDQSGKVALNFGPLNRDGGGRRLNVAVSRARYEMKVFSTLRADQIDLNRTSADGVADFKAFLEYAEKGRDFIAHNAAADTASNADNLVRAVADALRKRGYNVRTNIGCSGYRVDIGVVDPAKPDTYLLGILCDGYHYASSRTAGDREVTQPSVLRQLGWHIHHLWSMDWWEKPDKTLDAIVAAIEKAKTGAPDAPVRTIDLPVPEPVKVEEVPYVQPYTAYDLPSAVLSVEDFASGRNDSRILRRMNSIVLMEAPISRNQLFRRTLSSFGIPRMTVRVGARLEELMPQTNFVDTGTGDLSFYWHRSHKPEEYAQYRPDSQRGAEDIAPEEVAVAVVHVLEDQVSITPDALRREVAQAFHFSRLTEAITAMVNRGIDYAQSRGRIIVEPDRIKLAN